MPKKPARPSVYNKAEYVFRSNQFNKELEKIRSHRHEHGIKEKFDLLVKRWELPLKYNPHTDTVSYSSEDNAVQVIPYKNRNNRGYIAEKTKHSKDEEFSSLPVVYVGSGKQKTMYIDSSPHLEERRYLTLRIDLNEKKGVLMEQFGEQIDSYKKYAKQRKGREGETKYDPIKIYDMYHEEPSFTRIAKKLSGKEGNTTYNSELDAERKAVERAYHVAKEGIQNVEVKAQNREKA